MFDFDATLPLMAGQFLLLVVVLNALFFRPLSRVIEERQAYIQGQGVQARQKLAEAERLARQYEQELAQTRRQYQATILQAQEEATKEAATLVAAAQAEAQQQREQVEQQLQQQRQAALQTLQKQVDSLSNQILAKLLA